MLRACAFFDGMPDEAIRELTPHVEPRTLEPGAYLFHAGEPADAVFVVASGSLEVVRLRPPEEMVVNVIGPRGAVGELAILRGELRSASVRAKGRTLVFAIEGHAFLSWIHKWPEVAVAVARAAANTLVRAEREMHLGATRRLWAIVQDDASRPDLAIELARAALPYLRGAAASRVILWTPVERAAVVREGAARLEIRPIEGQSPTDLADRADEALGEAGLVVVAGPLSAVHDVSRRASAVVSTSAVALPRLAAAARHIELATRGAATANRVRTDGLTLGAVAGRVARLLTGRSIGVALGGGAARSMSHLGVLEALDREGVPIDFVAGTSMGSLVGAFLVKHGLAGALDFAQTQKSMFTWLRRLDAGILLGGLTGTKKMSREIDAALHHPSFADLTIPFAAIALDLDSGEEMVFREGPVIDALVASFSIPGVFEPHVCQPPGSTRRRRFVDGGVVNNVPVDAVRQMGADRVIGIHAHQREAQQAASAPTSWLAARVARVPTVARALTVVRSQLLGHERSGHRQVLAADLAVLIDTGNLGFTDFWKVDELIQCGRRAAAGIIEEIRLLRP